MPEEQKCNRCKVMLPICKFSLNNADKYLKQCDRCRAYVKTYRDTHKCKHDRERSKCKECGGSSICKHDRQRNICKECGGSSICEHDIQRISCKQCNDPVKVTIKNWLSTSKQSDKKHNRYDPVNFVDKCFCESMVEDYPNCCYCKCELQYVIFQSNLATIERTDDSLGHIKSNCVIACKSCNVRKIKS